MDGLYIFLFLILAFLGGVIVALARILKELLSISRYLDSIGEMWGEMLRELITNLKEPEDQDEDYNERAVGEDGL